MFYLFVSFVKWFGERLLWYILAFRIIKSHQKKNYIMSLFLGSLFWFLGLHDIFCSAILFDKSTVLLKESSNLVVLQGIFVLYFSILIIDSAYQVSNNKNNFNHKTCWNFVQIEIGEYLAVYIYAISLCLFKFLLQHVVIFWIECHTSLD